MKTKIDFLEGIGFSFEVLLFVFSGFFFWINYYISFLLFILGMALAVIVGKRIKRNARN